MAKKDLDKYYTPVDVAKRLIDKTFEIVGKENITEVIEPSAGAGAFSKQIENCIAYDIAPDDDSIQQADFLTLDIPYKPGRLIIGNPPYNSKRGTMWKKFLKKSMQIADYVAFIMPASLLNTALYDNILDQGGVLYEEELPKELFGGNINTIFVIIKKCEWIDKNIKKIDGINIRRSYRVDYHPGDFHIIYFGSSAFGELTNRDKERTTLSLRIDNEDFREYFKDNFNREDLISMAKYVSASYVREYILFKYVKKLYEQWQKRA